MAARDPLADLRQIAFLLERANEASYRVRAFRTAAAALANLTPAEVSTRAAAGTLTDLGGVGDVTARCVAESLSGEEPVYLRRLLATEGSDVDQVAMALRQALRGDCHAHSDWSDGGSPIEEMVTTAIALGHEYLVLTDHSPRLTVARGLSAERLREQLDVVAALNATLTANEVAFRLLTGIEVDILADGSLDQEESLLARLDVVVGSVHSGLRDDSGTMTQRMVAAVANQHLDILGHCTGRKLVPASAGGAGNGGTAGGAGKGGTAGGAGKGGTASGAGKGGTASSGGDRAHRGGRGRPESQFDAATVFAACRQHDKAVEINCRPDRLDPPKRLLRLAVEAGCRFSIDTDAHAPGQLDWLDNGCDRAALCGVDPATVVNTWTVDDLLSWAGSHA
ncbi:MAG: PHP domain-containing protein, partial [Micromonosporaceae bacterium]